MEIAKKGDFVELAYTARIKDGGMIFDTTDPETAKKEDLGDEKTRPRVICLGEQHILKGLDESLIGKEIGRQYVIELPAEKAYGKKDASLIRLLATGKFMKEKIMPQPGLTVSVDGMYGIIKTVSGGRTLVDFNHPLSGKDVVYDCMMVKKADDAGEKVRSVVGAMLGAEDAAVQVKEGSASVEMEGDIPEEVKRLVKESIARLVPEVKEVAFIQKPGKGSVQNRG